MLFNSYEFIFVFLPIVLLIYFTLSSFNQFYLSKIFLVISSLFFYSWWDVEYLPIIIISIFLNYSIGKKLSLGVENQKKLLIFGIAFNLLLLGYFKYTDFFIENYNNLTDSNIGLLHIVLPLAISFFTFQQIAFLVDSFRKKTQEYDFINYTIFVTFFPQLIAGPIVHHKKMMPQFFNKNNAYVNFDNISKGIFIFVIGLFKKVVIADTFAVWANSGFEHAAELNFIESWMTSLSYTFQLYFDFSGYTDMAIGAALFFNIKLPINFNSPYKAIDIQDFWRRWHITLSTFLKDYIYIPLGGNKNGNYMTYQNLLITFILGGIWHGAGWTFVFWGFLHGFAIVVLRIWRLYHIKLNRIFAWILTFNFVNIAWVFFRATSWNDAIHILKSMFDLSNVVLPSFLYSKLAFLQQYGVGFGYWMNSVSGNVMSVFIVFCAFIMVLLFKNSNERIHEFKPSKIKLFEVLMIFFISLLFLNNKSDFLYFNF